MTNIPRFSVDNILFIFIDLQTTLLNKIETSKQIISRNSLLLEAAKKLTLPYLITSQYRKGLGEVDERFSGDVIDKTSFSCAGNERFRNAMKASNREWIALSGVETHICVTQTCLDLLRNDRNVAVIADAVGARRELDHRMGLKRMEQAGALLTTTEMVIYELLERSDTEAFKKILPLIKSLQ